MGEKNFFKHFLAIGTGTLINMILGVLTTPIITRIVDPSEYGQFSVFTLYTSIGVMVLCLGMDQALVRFFYEKDDIRYKQGLLFRCVTMSGAVSVVTLISFLVLAFSGLLRIDFSKSVCILLGLNVIGSIVYRFSQLLVRLEYKSKLFSVLNVTHRLVYLFFALALIAVMKDHYLECLTVATVVSVILCMLISMISERTLWTFRRDSLGKCELSNKELLRYSLPLVVAMGLATVFQSIDQLSIKHFCTYAEVGVYSSAMILVNVFAIVQSTFNSLWGPMAMEHHSKDPEDRTFYQKGNSAITVVMFAIGISLILMKDVFALLLGEKYREASYILPFLIFHPIMYTISETTQSGIGFSKKSYLQIIVSAVSCIFNIVGNTILVPEYGGRGAAISTGLSYILFFSLKTYFSVKYYPVDFKLKKFYFLTAATGLYALYNTFFEFGIITVVGYVLCIVLEIVLYKDTVVWCIRYLKKNISGVFS